MGVTMLSTFRTTTLVAVLTTVWLAVPSVCRASLIFDFSFSGVPLFPGTVTGEIDLPDNANNNTTAATSVIIDTSTIASPITLPFDTLSHATQFLTNTFTVSNGVITAANYVVC